MPHRGQYAVTLSASKSRPRACSCFSDHQTDSMYSVSIVQYASDMSIQNRCARSSARTHRRSGHRLAAQPVELGDAERLDVALARGTDLLLDLDLHRQAVAVPPALPRHEVAGHRLEARVHVLEGARLDVMDAGRAVRRRWTLVEDPERIALAGAGCFGRTRRARARRRVCARSSSGSCTFGSPARTGASPPPLTRPDMRNASSLCRDEALAPRYHPACRAPPAPEPLTAAHHGLPLSRAGPGCVYCGSGGWPDPVRAAARGGSSRGSRAGLPPSPARFGREPRYSFPSSPLDACYTRLASRRVRDLAQP